VKLDWTQNPEHLQWFESQLQVKFESRPTYWTSVLRNDGSLVGGMIYTNFSEFNCEISAVLSDPRCCTKRILGALFGYPFHQLNLRRVTAVVRASNVKSSQICQHRAGFALEGALRNWFGDEPALIWGLLKEDCKWL
jgi:RimJ/RimL family protein N-acetyltransferase